MTTQVPDYVQQASEAEQYGTTQTAPQLFADRTHRRYPFHTKAACWRSAEALASQPEHTAAREDIKLAATAYGMEAEIDRLWATTPQQIKYAYTRANEDGSLTQHLPLRNPTEVQAAANYLQQYRDTVHLRDRQKIAAAVLDAAAEFGLQWPNDTHHELLKQAGRGECTANTLKVALAARAALFPASDPMHDVLSKMATAVTTRSTREVRIKLASTLDALDRETGIAREYAHGLLRPEDALFGLTHATLKTAKETELRLQDGTVFRKDALAPIQRAAVCSWLGDEVADECWGLNAQEVDHEKLAAVAETLPPPAARRFTQCAASCGVAPL